MMRRIENVVVGSSLGEASDAAVRAGLEIAAATGARLHLVHAYPVPVVYGGTAIGVAAAQPQLLEAERQFCQQRLEEQLARIEVDADRLASTQLDVGVPHRLLEEVAAREHADLLVVGAAETHGALAPLLGSTCDRVLRKATRPVLVVRGALPVPPGRVLAPVDLSPLAEESLERGLRILSAIGGGERPQIEVLFVLSSAEREGSLHFTPVQIERFAREELEAVLRRVDPDDSFALTTQLRTGTPRAQILEDLERRPADLVMLGTHGRSGFERFLLGSVAADLARQAPASVLVIPPGTEAAAASHQEQAT